MCGRSELYPCFTIFLAETYRSLTMAELIPLLPMRSKILTTAESALDQTRRVADGSRLADDRHFLLSNRSAGCAVPGAAGGTVK